MYKKITKIKEFFDAKPRDNYDSTWSENAICMDIPLAIRILEYAREDAQSDLDIHVLAKRLIEVCREKRSTLNIDDYTKIVEGAK